MTCSKDLRRVLVGGIGSVAFSLLLNPLSAFDPAHPDLVEQFHIPPSNERSSVKPEGN